MIPVSCHVTVRCRERPSCSRCLWWSTRSTITCVTSAIAEKLRTSGELSYKSGRRCVYVHIPTGPSICRNSLLSLSLSLSLSLTQTSHKKTFLYLEQLILKHRMHSAALKVKEASDGLDFFFALRQGARKLVDFLHTVVPCRFTPSYPHTLTPSHHHTLTPSHIHSHTPSHTHRYKTSQELVSHDIHNNTYQYKHTFSVEIVPVCKVRHEVCQAHSHEVTTVPSVVSVVSMISAVSVISVVSVVSVMSVVSVVSVVSVISVVSVVSLLQNEVVCLPLKLSRSLGHMTQIALCTRVTTSLHLTDPQTLQGESGSL